VLEEVLDLFPSEFIHVGGDECPKDEWRASPAAQARMRDLGLRDEDELQSWFLSQIGTFLHAQGRRMVGWDEILEGGLPPGATVMSWHGETGGIEAARLGHDVVMTPDTHTYFDYYQAPPEGEPLAIGGLIDLETVYAYDPPVLGGRTLGSQFQLWTEYMPTPAHVEYMAFPRACAFAEVVWSGRNPGFADRLADHLTRLEGVNFRGAVRPAV
jgi:hexosaminidase